MYIQGVAAVVLKEDLAGFQLAQATALDFKAAAPAKACR